LASAAFAAPAAAQTIALPEIVNIAAPPRQTDPLNAGSEQTRTGESINAVPVSRPGEALEAAPGLIVTQHSGEGKANQYFLRGFNLDHGTDLSITVEGMPVNMRTHGHGQGYADINFLIPELIQAMRVRKGPYFADEGDFASAGALHVDYLDRLDPGLAQITAGSFGYRRGLAAKSTPAGAGSVLVATEAGTYDGPWDVPDRVRKINGLMRYSQGTPADGFSILALAYANRWTSTDQVARRAIDEGLIGRFGSLDPSDGGEAGRYSLSGRWSRTEGGHATRVEAYAIKSDMRLFNNFTYVLDDPVNGDQFSQFDHRVVTGGHASHSVKARFGGLDMENRVGVQARHDDIALGLQKTAQRALLSTVRRDHVRETSVGVYAQNTTYWTDWLRTVTGIRGDSFQGTVASDTAANSGNAKASVASPKFSLVLGPFAATEFFFNAGYGFHSNDLRGATITVDPSDGVTPLPRVPLLVRSRGAEVGVRTRAVPGLESAVVLFGLDYDSELLFVGDAGTTVPSRPSRRTGVEWTNHYQVNAWLGLDLDVTVTRARFTSADPVGDRVPGAPEVIAAAGVTLGGNTGWFGAAKLRYFGARPLVEDDSVRSDPTLLFNARAGYRFDNGMRLQVDALNLLDTRANQIDYYYASRLATEPAGAAIGDRHVHPVEPLAVRVTFAAPL
jgi:outer membrane receptor protein involved in Fe transport